MATGKKSAFDVLMNKINKKDELIPPCKNQKLKETRKDSSKNDDKKSEDSENEIIIISEVSTKTKKNIDLEHEWENYSFKDRFNNFEIDPFHLKHTQQFSEKDEEFMNSLNLVKPKFKLKQELDPIFNKIEKSSFLNFDFSKYDHKVINQSEDIIQITNQDINKTNKVLNNDFEELKQASPLEKSKDHLVEITSSHLLDTPTTSRIRNSKRRKTELKVSPKSLKTPTNEIKNQLWTEKYQFQNEKEIVTNKSQYERLKQWLNNWKSILSKTNNDDSNSEANDSDSDYSDSNLDSSSSGNKFYSNAILLSGPHGSGKTSSVYTIAKQLGFKVFEVNSSSLRSKTQIIQDLEGVLDSHHVTKNKASLNFKMENFFKKENSKPKTNVSNNKTQNSKKRKSNKTSCPYESVIELTSDSDNSDNRKAGNLHKESLILFDEIDVVFKEDVGFLSAIYHFVKKSKKPVILTTSDDFVWDKLSLDIEQIEFIRPKMDTALGYLRKIANLEGYKIEDLIIQKILQESKGDMRRSINELQALIGSNQKTIQNLNNTNLIVNFLTNTNNLLYLDFLTSHILKLPLCLKTYKDVTFKRYDMFIIKDGFNDFKLTSSISFNPFQTNNDRANKDEPEEVVLSFFQKKLIDYFKETISLIHKDISLNEWLNLGKVNEFDYIGNNSINRLAQGLFKFTSNKSISLDYRPYLYEICKLEEIKQAKGVNKRRYIHHLSYTKLGLLKEDMQLLSKSKLSEVNFNYVQKEESNVFDTSIYSNE
ncbi:unnamed protein product [Brachionus calyciflorus]|uniref:AAA+ ATPase domain-containing protein n=1 Tax=Brachionus calyciflorus TaxID=104777 RepID=A0A813VAC0_9BILA|nr:unnamed protein product [Brachionus calyciflorus]